MNDTGSRAFGKQLEALRRRRRLTVKALAERCDVSISAVFWWETGRSSPRLEHLDALARALSVTIAVTPRHGVQFLDASETTAEREVA